ncbi:MAG: NAD-dependent epimerase/dehydratase family protein [Ligilactobacillus agilis]|nr:NAD-dependent epimerase/dehydratase family protein [Ligilactobacillus agilis]
MSNYSDTYRSLLDKAISANRLKLAPDTSGILVTGATGLIGASIIDMLVRINDTRTSKFFIYVAARNLDKVKMVFKNYINKDYFKYVYYDATEPIDFNNVKVDYIIQGASNASPNLYTSNPVETLLGNVLGIKNILDYAKTKNIRKVVYISSSEVYGNSESRQNVIAEDDYGNVDVLKVRSSYMLGKQASENLCVSYAKEYGIDVSIVRPGHIYGPHISEHDKRASSEFLRNASNHEKIVMNSSGRQLRSYCHAVDCASAILYVLEAGENGEAYNISNKKSIVTIREFAECVSKIGKVSLEIGKDDNAVISYSALDSEKLEQKGWQAVVDINAGIEEVIEDLS